VEKKKSRILSCMFWVLMGPFLLMAIAFVVFTVLVMYDEFLPNVEYVQFNPANPRMILMLKDGGFAIWDITNNSDPEQLCYFRDLDAYVLDPNRTSLERNKPLNLATFSLSGDMAAFGCRNGNVWLVKNINGSPVLERVDFLRDGVTNVAFSPDGKLLVAGSETGELKRWVIDTQIEGWEIAQQTRRINDIAFSEDGKMFLVGSGTRDLNGPTTNESSVTLWTSTGNLVATVEESVGKLALDIDTVPDGNYFAVAYDEGTELYNFDGSFRHSDFSAKPSNSELLAISEDGKYLSRYAWGGYDVWNLTTDSGPTFVNEFTGSDGETIHNLAFLPDGHQMVVTGTMFHISDVQGNILLEADSPHKDFASAMSVSSDGQLIATVGINGSFRIWNRDGTKYADFR
jgi:WD40 repeat protein